MKRFVSLIALVCFGMPVAAGESASKDADQQILGAWELQFTAPDGVQRTPLVIVGRQHKDYVAWYVGEKEPQPFQDVQLQGDKLVGKITPAEQPDITVTVESTLKAADQCEGTATYRAKSGTDTGSWKFSGRRLALSSFDEVMKWKLSFVTPDNERHEPTVTVVSKKGQLYAWYSDRDYELPARSLTVQGDRAEMKMSAKAPDGAQVDVTFRGTVVGDELEGTAEYRLPDQSGSFPIKGKRTS